ncbi:MAG: hypothetical protein IJ736_06985 [Firmicutes bacterium]|nr:hypothetical protein [Bacillota bacterium]
MKKFKIYFSVFLIIIIIAIIVFAATFIILYTPFAETAFYRVYDTGSYRETCISHPAKIGETIEDILEYNESYIVANAPETSDELKQKIKEFEKERPYRESAYDKSDSYRRIYIKESREMDRYWKPTFFDGHEEYHYDCIIAETLYFKKTGEKIYKIKDYDNNEGKLLFMENKLYEEYEEPMK